MNYSLPVANELRNAESQQQQFTYRLIAMGLLVLVCFGLLVYRWSVLQIVRHEDYIAQAESNRTAVVPVVPSRGEIRDRNGIVLASNYSAYTPTRYSVPSVATNGQTKTSMPGSKTDPRPRSTNPPIDRPPPGLGKTPFTTGINSVDTRAPLSDIHSGPLQNRLLTWPD